MAGRPPWRLMLPLAATVLAAHLALLGAPPRLVQAPGTFAVRPLTTRSIPVDASVRAPTAAKATAEPAPLQQNPAAISRPPERAAPVPGPSSAESPAATLPAEARQVAAANSTALVAPAVPEIATAHETPAAPEVPMPGPVSAGRTSARGIEMQTLAIPEPSRIRYEVVAQIKGLTLEGHAQLRWRHDGSEYEARLEVGGPFVPTRIQRSTGRITEQGLAPGYFSDKGRSEQATHFERDKGKLSFSNNQPDAPLVAGMQDRLSVIVQLSVLIGGQPERYPAGTSIAIPTASTREAETWVFTVEGEENLALPGGAQRALKLQRNPRKEYDQKVELWLAPRMDYAPVRLRLTNPNGDSLDQRWASTDKG